EIPPEMCGTMRPLGPYYGEIHCGVLLEKGSGRFAFPGRSHLSPDGGGFGSHAKTQRRKDRWRDEV
ncbi:MAG: hypothetical protein ACOYKN_19830, partial [Pirellula sp.]